jgi:hypothetical protein
VLIIQTSQHDSPRSKELTMFNTSTIRNTRLASFFIACTMTLAMLGSINGLATSEAHPHQMAAATASASGAQS